MMMMMISYRVKHRSYNRQLQDGKKGTYETDPATCCACNSHSSYRRHSPMMTYKMKRKPDVRVHFRCLNSLKPYLWFQPITLGIMAGGGRDTFRNTNVLKLENIFDEKRIDSHKYVIIIINIKDWTLWSVLSPELQLLATTLLRSSNCSPSLWSVVVWFQRDSVLWRSLQVRKPVPSVFIYLA